MYRFLKIYLLIFIFCCISYFFFDFSLFPVLYYSPMANKIANLIGIFIFSVCARTVLFTFLYCKILRIRTIKVLVISLLLNGLPIQFTEGFLMYITGYVGYSFTAFDPKFVCNSVISKIIFIILNLIINYINDIYLSIIIYVSFACTILEVPRVILGIYLNKKFILIYSE